MTIALYILKEFLIKNISKWHVDSISKDQSTSNAVFSFVGFGRNKDLSSYKQKLATDVIKTISDYEGAGTDAESLTGLMDLLRTAKKAANIEANTKGYSQGTFAKAIDKTCNMAQDIYDKLGEYQFVDAEYAQSDPFDVLRYVLSSYLAQKVYETYHPSLIKYYTQHPNISNMAQLSSEREQIIRNAMENCLKKIDRLDKTNVDYHIARKEVVLEIIGALKRDNLALCEHHGIQIIIPVISVGLASVSMGMPPLHPDSGCIEVCMEEAINLIEKAPIIKSVENKDIKQKVIGDFFPKAKSSDAEELDNQEELVL